MKNALWTLLGRELARRRMVLWASVAIGVLAAMTPYLAPRGSLRVEELRGVVALAVLILWPTLLALGSGATIFTRDLAERRLAFDFRLPVSGNAIWAARLVAVMLTVLLAAAAVVAPSLVLGLDVAGASAALDLAATPGAPLSAGGTSAGADGLVLWLPVFLAVVILLANLAGLALFVRSAWSVVDLSTLVIAILLLVRALDLLSFWSARRTAAFVLYSAAVAIALVLVLAGRNQVVLGRTEILRAARSYSITLAVGAALVAMFALGFSVWSTRPVLNDLTVWGAQPRPVGERWVAVVARASHRESWFRFLVDARSGDWIRLGPLPAGPFWRSGVQTTTDESLVAWLECSRSSSTGCETELWTAESKALGKGEPTGLTWPDRPAAWALSPRGDRIATRRLVHDEAAREEQSRWGWWTKSARIRPVASHQLVIEEIASRRVERIVGLPAGCGDGPLAFTGQARVTVACGVESRWNDVISASRFEVDLSTGTTRVLRRYFVDGTRADSPDEINGEEFRPLERDSGYWIRTIERVDRATGVRKAILEAPPGHTFGHGISGRILGNRWSVLWLAPQSVSIAIYDEHDRLVHTVRLAHYSHAIAESRDSRFVLLIDSDWRTTGRCENHVSRLEVSTGQIEQLALTTRAEVSGLLRTRTVLIQDCDSRYLWFDRESGELVPLTWLDPSRSRDSWFWSSTGRIESTLENERFGF